MQPAGIEALRSVAGDADDLRQSAQSFAYVVNDWVWAPPQHPLVSSENSFTATRARTSMR